MGQMTDEIRMQIFKRIEVMFPDVVVLYSGVEFGRETSTMYRSIIRIRYLGAEVDSMRGLLPDTDYMSVLGAVSTVFADLDIVKRNKKQKDVMVKRMMQDSLNEFVRSLMRNTGILTASSTTRKTHPQKGIRINGVSSM